MGEDHKLRTAIEDAVVYAEKCGYDRGDLAVIVTDLSELAYRLGAGLSNGPTVTQLFGVRVVDSGVPGPFSWVLGKPLPSWTVFREVANG